MTDIEAGDVVIGVPLSQCNCPHEHGPEWNFDHDDTAGKMFRVLTIGPDPQGSPCIVLTLREDPTNSLWCCGTFRKIRPGHIPSPSVQELEPA